MRLKESTSVTQSDTYNLDRFLKAQQDDYATALAEIRGGHKRSHWMWYIFPQIAGLGQSETAKYYAIQNMEEATAYLHDPVLGYRLLHICEALLELPTNDATAILGSPDDMKLRSSMTLFGEVRGSNPVFQQVLDKFYEGKKDSQTIQLLN